MNRRLALLVLFSLASPLAAAEPTAHPARFGAGAGPRPEGAVWRLLDAERSPGQSNAVAFDRAQAGAFEALSLTCRLRVLPGGDGGAFLFLNTREYGERGPAPFLPSWIEPNLRGTFAVGIDVHDPPTEEPFGPDGNVLGLPEREVSLHWDGREIVKRLGPEEFRGDWAECAIEVRFVTGGAEVTVRLGAGTVFDRFFVPGMQPYEARLAIGAGTRADATTEFDVADVRFEGREPARPRRAPLHFEVVNHVLTDNARTAFAAEVDLPPAEWAFGRVVLRLEIHDAGDRWDEWDRNGEISVVDADGVKHGIVPFITSYRTPCRWDVDVTHFRPWLAGRTKLEVAAGTTFYKNRGFMMSVSLDFYPGSPDLVPFQVVPLWHGNARHGAEENHYRDFFDARSVPIDGDARAARVFTTVTGHSQVGEFTPMTRTLIFAPETGGDPANERRFTDRLWKTDCYLNPNRPQFGTWKYPRAGWAPGDVVRPWTVDLTPWLVPGQTAEFRYDPGPYEFPEEQERPSAEAVAAASQVVRSYLVLYRAPDGLVPPPALRVTGVAAGSGAAEAGVKEGDWLSAYDGRPLLSIDDLHAAIEAGAASGRDRLPIVLDLEIAPGRMGVNLAVR